MQGLRKVITIGWIAIGLTAFTDVKPKVIYGNDDRKDVYEETDAQLLELSRSTMAVVDNTNLEETEDKDVFALSNTNYGESQNLCKEERFIDQPSAAFCSAFLVGPDLVVTAGHCVRNYSCSQTSFVFDFKMNSEKEPQLKFHTDQIYKCKQIIKREYISEKQDYTLLQLDREVVGRTPLKLRKSGEIQTDDELIMMGHPSGLPLKIAGGAKVRKVPDEKIYFEANTDSYGGNSGSVVFNAKTLEVEGILVRGEQDFSYDTSAKCYRSLVCKDDGCRGEDITMISFVSKILNP